MAKRTRREQVPAKDWMETDLPVVGELTECRQIFPAYWEGVHADGSVIQVRGRYLRSSCADSTEPNTIDYTKMIARSYGLTDKLADTVAERSHAGTQYLQYIWSGLYMLKEISYLQEQVDAGMLHRLWTPLFSLLVGSILRGAMLLTSTL